MRRGAESSPWQGVAAWLRAPASGGFAAGPAGAAYLALVSVAFGLAVVDPQKPMLGSSSGAVENLIRTRYADEISRIYVLVVGATILAGTFLGWTAALLLAARQRLQRNAAPSRMAYGTTLLALIVLLHASILAWSMVRHPETYADCFYFYGGWRRGFEIAVADHLSPTGIVSATVIAAVLFLLGDPRRWRKVFAGRALPSKSVTLALAGGVLVLAGVVVVLLAPGRPVVPAARRDGKMNVVVLASDGLRPDRIRPDLAPRLAALSNRGTRFERAYTTVARTFPSWMTILTGRFPHHHGIRSTWESWNHRARSFDTLADRFTAAGYRTAVVSDYAGDVFPRAPFGFEDVHTPHDSFRQVLERGALTHDVMLLPFLDNPIGRAALPALQEDASWDEPKSVAKGAIDEIRSASDQPFFLVVFFSATHFPYSPPYPYSRRYTDTAYRGIFKYGNPVGLTRSPPPTAEDVRQVRALYDGAVASIDDAAGLVLDELARDGHADDTIVFLTSDHGESLFEPRPDVLPFAGHGDHLFGDEGTHVPLVIVDPRQGPHVATALVSTVNIAPTIYELTSVAPPSDLDGRSLASAVSGGALSSAPVFAETGLWLTQSYLPESLRIPSPGAVMLLHVDEQHGDEITVRPDLVDLTLAQRHRMVRDERWKLVYMPSRDGVRYALFDTLHDPEEIHDVLAAEQAEGNRLGRVLWKWMLEDPLMREERGYLLPKDSESPGAGTANEAVR